ncbi:MAG TPA: glycosyltransferase family 4 protein [Beijerinckiaceae bacterium]
MPVRLNGLSLLMTADAVGGVWQYATDLARALAEHGVETTLAVLGPTPSAEALAEAASIPSARILVTGLPLDWTAESPGEIVEAGRAVAELAREVRADIVHLNSPALAADARFPAPVVGVCHSCLATWWQAVRSGPLPADFAWRTALLSRGYRAADALTAPTAAFARMTAAAYGIPEPFVVRNGRRPSPRPEASAAPADLVFTAGRLWDEGKNLLALDRAAARLTVPVVAAGPLMGPNGAAVALPHLRTLGRLSDKEVRGWLARLPAFVSVPRYEPFGLAVLEAAQAGCALVLSDIPTLRELWDGAALFVDPQDDRAIADAIASLIAEPTQRAALGAAAEKRAGQYTVEAAAKGMMAIYERLTARAAVREAVA